MFTQIKFSGSSGNEQLSNWQLPEIVNVDNRNREIVKPCQYKLQN